MWMKCEKNDPKYIKCSQKLWLGCSTLPTNVWILSHVFWETVVVTGHVVLFGWFLLPPVCGTLKGHLLGLQLTVTVVVVFIFIFLASAFLQMQALEVKTKEITLIISWGWSHFGCNCKLTGVNLFPQNLHPFFKCLSQDSQLYYCVSNGKWYCQDLGLWGTIN